MHPNRAPLALLTAIASTAIILMVTLLGAGWLMTSQKFSPEVELPILATMGMLILVAALALIAVAFQTVNLSDSQQPLGLPSGSVRSLLAIGLLLLMAIISLFLYISSSQGKLESKIVLASQADSFEKSLPPGALYGTGLKGGDAKTPTVEYKYKVAPDPQSQDIAKQLVTLLGTLLASVVAFYFGASTAITAQSDKSGTVGPPKIDAVTPKRLPVNAARQRVVVSGQNLDMIQSVNAVSGNTKVPADDVTSNATSVQCYFTFGVQQQGTWAVEVADKLGRRAILAEALLVTVASPP